MSASTARPGSGAARSAALNGRPPFRADHIGSLLRPASLRQAHRLRASGAINAQQFAQAQDAAIEELIALQEGCGLPVVTDGEARRGSYWSRFVERVQGFRVGPAAFRFRDENGAEAEFTAPFIAARLRRVRPIALDEFEFLQAHTSVIPKITLPSAPTIQFYGGRQAIDEDVYVDREVMFAELGQVYREELQALYDAGLRYAQIDDVPLAMLCDPIIRDRVATEGDDPEYLVDLYIRAINECLRGLPDDLIVGLHLCRGNFKGRFLSAGGYDPVAEKLFSEVAVNHFLLEYDSDRAGDFEALRHLPADKGAVLGLISSKRAELESIGALRRRVEQAAKIVDLGRLALSPQCGFASTVAGNPVSEDIQRAKLIRVVEAAAAIWGSEA